jgi:hypothetical protein
MILSGLVGVFRLQKDVIAGDRSGAIRFSQRLSNLRFELVLTLIGRINGSKAALQSQCRQFSRVFFFPCGAVDELGLLRGAHRRVLAARI